MDVNHLKFAYLLAPRRQMLDTGTYLHFVLYIRLSMTICPTNADSPPVVIISVSAPVQTAEGEHSFSVVLFSISSRFE